MAVHTPPISQHRVLSNGHSIALLRPDAEIDWWCAPSPDDPPLCWSLLDPDGGRARYAGAAATQAEPAGSLAAPCMRTVLETAEGARLECWDGLVQERGGAVLVRLIRAVDDELDVEHIVTVGGFDQPRGRWQGSSQPQARLRTCGVHLDGGTTRLDGPAACTRLRAARGVWAALTVGVGLSLPADPRTLTARLHAAEDSSRGRRACSRPPGHLTARAIDALAVLEACTYSPTGASLASPTTSLPEWPGGPRQFDYRYTWLRDASLAVSTAALLGRRDIAAEHLRFLHALTDDGRRLPGAPVTTVHGEPVPDEREIPGVDGWASSQPVRVGNAAGEQSQPDALGLCVEAISVYVQQGGALDGATWRLVCTIADHLADEQPSPSAGIWELREPRWLVSSDIGRWIGLDRAVWVARGWRPATRRRHWLRARKAVRERVLSSLRSDGGLPHAYDETEHRPDAASLMAALFRLLDHRDSRAKELVQVTIRELGEGPLLFRYLPGTDPSFEAEEARGVSRAPTGWEARQRRPRIAEEARGVSRAPTGWEARQRRPRIAEEARGVSRAPTGWEARQRRPRIAEEARGVSRAPTGWEARQRRPFIPDEGAFLPVSWWAVSALAAVGDIEAARQRAKDLDACLPRLLAEEAAIGGQPRRRESFASADGLSGQCAGLGNVPLLWSHMEAARAAYLLDSAARRARWGAIGLAAWRLGRYTSLRLGTRRRTDL